MESKMKLKLTLLVSTSMLFLVGCSTNPFATQAQIFNEQFNSAVVDSKKCYESVASNPDVVLTYEQIIVKGLNAPNRSELLATDKKLNEQQRVAFLNYMKIDNTCFDGVMEKVRGNPYANLLQSSETLSAINDSNLVTGKITIAEANAKRLEILQKFLTDITLLREQLKTQHLQEQMSDGFAAQNAINNMNTATKIQQNQMTQQLLQQQNQNRFLGR